MDFRNLIFFSDDLALVERVKSVAAVEFLSHPPKQIGDPDEEEDSFIFLHCSSDFSEGLCSRFGLPEGSFCVLTVSTAFLCPSMETTDEIRSFLESVRKGEATRFLKSQERTPNDRLEGDRVEGVAKRGERGKSGESGESGESGGRRAEQVEVAALI